MSESMENYTKLPRYQNWIGIDPVPIEAVVDRFVVRKNQQEEDGPSLEEMRQRLTDSVETALKLGSGVMIVADISDRDHPSERTFSGKLSCPNDGTSFPEIEPRTFSFNSPHGACPTCTDLAPSRNSTRN